MSAQANPDHRPETLLSYARLLFDVAARFFRKYPFETNDTVVRSAMVALRLADRLYAGAPRNDFVMAAKELNDAAAAFNVVLLGRGQSAFSFVKVEKVES